MGHLFIVSPILQFAVAITDRAVHAEVITLAKNQGQDEFAGIEHFVSVGVDHHAIGCWQGAGGLQRSGTFHIHHAQAASAIRR